MMTNNNGPITKIYKLEVSGADVVIKSLQSITKEYQQIRKAKIELNNLKAGIEDPARLKDLENKIKALSIQESELADKIKSRRTEMELINKLTQQQTERTVQSNQAASQAAAATGNLSQRLVQTRSSLASVNTALKTNEQAFRAGTITEEVYTATAALLTRQQGQLQASLRQTNSEFINQTRQTAVTEDSLIGLSLTLDNLKRQYERLSAAQRQSVEGQAMLQNIQRLNTEVTTLSSSIGNNQRNVGNYTNSIVAAFGKGYGFLRQIANIVPNLGISTIFLLAYEGISKVVGALFQSQEGFDVLTAKIKAYNLAISEGNKEAGGQIENLKLLYTTATNTAKAQKDRIDAARELQALAPTTFGQLNEEAILTGKAADAYKELAKQIVASGRAKAAEGKLKDIGAQLLDLDAQEQKIRNANRNEKARAKDRLETVAGDTESYFGSQTINYTAEQQRRDSDKRAADALDLLAKKRAALNAQEQVYGKFVDDGKDKTNDATGSINQLQKQLTQLKTRYDALSPSVKGYAALQASLVKDIKNTEAAIKARQDAVSIKPGKEYSGSRLSGYTKDDFKEIDALRDEQLAKENTAANDIERVRKLSFDEEKQHLLSVEKINVDALNKKIAILQQRKSLNAEEKATLAKFGEDISSIELSTSEKIQAIEKKRYDYQEQQLKNQLDQTVQAARDAADLIRDNVNAAAGEKAQAQLDADNKALKAEQDYYNNLLKLNKDYSDEAIVQARKTITALKKAIGLDTKDLALSTLADIEQATDNAITAIKLRYDRLKSGILNSGARPEDKKQAIDSLNQSQDVEVKATQLQGYDDLLEKARQLRDTGLLTEKQFGLIYHNAVQGQEDLNNAITQGLIKVTDLKSFIAKNVRSLFNFDKINPDDDAKTIERKKNLQQQFADTLTQTYQTAQNALNAYYDNERARIEQSLRIGEQRLDRELEQQKARSQSQAESASLDKEYALKKQALEKEAFEQNKKMQRAQAQINLATQLSNLAVIAFSPGPLNLTTLGLAGQIMYGVQAALALVNYGLNISRINSAQFGKGGLLKKFAYGGSVPTRGGRFGGRPHSKGGTPFSYRGRAFEAELDEIAVIRTKNASRNKVHSFTGTQSQIASALNVEGGGVDFAPGARPVRRFDYGGAFTNGLQAPVFVPAASSARVAGNSSEKLSSKFDELKESLSSEIRNLADEQSKRIDRIEVQQVTSTVTNAQKREVKQNNLGTL